MNEQDKSINRLKYQKGVVSYEGKSGVPYKWMMHENKGWFENAKRIQGDDWYWGSDKAPEITYVLDDLGFRNDRNIEEVSKNPNWWLIDGACPCLGPGIDKARTTPALIEQYTDIKVYDISLFGVRPEFQIGNLLELSKRWINPPKRVLLLLPENPTGTFQLTDDDKIMNIDYAGATLRNTPEFNFFKDFEEQKISEGQHRYFIKTTIKLCEVLNLPLTWLFVGKVADHSPVHYMENQDILYHEHASIMHSNSKDTYEDRIMKIKKGAVPPMRNGVKASGVDIDDVGRDLFHPGLKPHKLFAQKICNHFLETKRNF